MGWTFQEKPRDVRRYFFDQLSWESDKAINRCLALALKINVCYAAIETTYKDTGRTEVWALVCLLRYVRNPADGFDFGTKDMTEHCGPVQADCPARILDLLTETDDENANEWRARCRENLARRMPKIGTRVRFAHPIRFTDGSEEDEFQVVRAGKRRKILRGCNGRHYRLSRRVWRDYEWSVLQEGA